MRVLSMLCVAGLAAATFAPASAHHSFAMFDNKKVLELDGVVKEFQWTNPRTWIQLTVKNAQGGTDEWAIEGSSPNGLTRQGWNRRSLKPGDQVKVKINPLKSGEKGGSFVQVVFADGRTLGGSNIPSTQRRTAD